MITRSKTKNVTRANRRLGRQLWAEKRELLWNPRNNLSDTDTECEHVASVYTRPRMDQQDETIETLAAGSICALGSVGESAQKPIEVRTSENAECCTGCNNALILRYKVVNRKFCSAKCSINWRNKKIYRMREKLMTRTKILQQYMLKQKNFLNCKIENIIDFVNGCYACGSLDRTKCEGCERFICKLDTYDNHCKECSMLPCYNCKKPQLKKQLVTLGCVFRCMK
jgi:hypothetical protein